MTDMPLSISSKISIHAPLTGSDPPKKPNELGRYKFQSTLPLRGATHTLGTHSRKEEFQSTLPLRGATVSFIGKIQWQSLISIHAPLTGSDVYTMSVRQGAENFNPRSPYGERPVAVTSSTIAIHFNPRSPYGERHLRAIRRLVSMRFQSTLPLRGATSRNCHN